MGTEFPGGVRRPAEIERLGANTGALSWLTGT